MFNQEIIDQEFTFKRGDCDILLKLSQIYLLIEAYNRRDCLSYARSYTNEEISELTENTITRAKDLFDILKQVLDPEKGVLNTVSSCIFAKFHKKTVSLSFKILINVPVQRSVNFNIELTPIKLDDELIKVQQKLNEINNRLSAVEKFFDGNPNFNEICSRLSILESKIGENFKGFIKISKVISNETNDILLFNSNYNSEFFKFKSDRKISRNTTVRGRHIVIFGSKPLNKNFNSFKIQISNLNKSFDLINACVGLISGKYLGKIKNLADHSGEGCYLYGINSKCIWINNTKQIVKETVGKIGDVILVDVDFNNKNIFWKFEGNELGKGKLEENDEFYPALTLAYPNEAIELI